MGKKSGPKVPDYSKQIEQQNQLARESLDFYKSVYFNDLAPRQQRYDAILEDQLARQNAISDFGFKQSQDEWARYQRDFIPIEASLAAEAMGLDPGAAVRGARETMFREAATMANADVNQAYANAEGQLGRAQSRSGVNPASGNAGANQTMLAMQKARDMAFGQNSARRYADQQSWAKRADVANMGRGIAGGNLAGAGLSLNASNSATGTGGAGIQSARANSGVMGQGFQMAGQFGMNAANIQNMAFQNQVAADQAGGGIGDIFGTVLGAGLGMFTGGMGSTLGAGLGKKLLG